MAPNLIALSLLLALAAAGRSAAGRSGGSEATRTIRSVEGPDSTLEVRDSVRRGSARNDSARSDSARSTSLRADSAGKAREVAVTREAFAYGGGNRDPFVSLINSAKTGPELADLQLVGVYENLRSPSSSVIVLREKSGGKRHKMWVGDQLGRLRLAQIRSRDAVFLIQDFGFERRETLSLRKQEEATP